MSDGGGRRPGRRMLTVGLVGAALVLSGCSRAPEAGTAEDLLHVHDLLVAPDGQHVWVASHTGLWEVVDGQLRPTSGRFDDLMSATIAADGTLLASGHPALGDDEGLREPGAPPLLGLVAGSGDGEWEPRALLGEADFHALTRAGGRLFGADGMSGRVLVSDDEGRTWQARPGEVELVDLAVDPDDLDR